MMDLSPETVQWQLNDALSSARTAREQIFLEQRQTATVITEHFESAREALVGDLARRKDQLLLQNRDIASRRCTQLDERILELETRKKWLEMRQQAQGSETSPASQEELFECHSLASVPLPAKIVFKHTSVEDLKEVLEPQLQQASISLLCHPPHCYIDVPQGGVMCHASKSVSLEVFLHDEEWTRLCCEQGQVTAHLLNESSEFASVTKCHVTSHPDGSCSLTFTAPAREGIHSLHVMTGGEGIKGSPYQVRVYSSTDHLFPAICHPHARYCAVQGKQLIVSAREKASLTAYNLSNFEEKEEIQEFEFTNPRGIAVSGNVLLVADILSSRKGRVVKMEKESGEIECFAVDNLEWPLGLQLDQEGTLFVTSMESSQIKVYTPSSSGSYTYHTTLNMPYKPYDLAFDSDGHLHVSYGDATEKVKGIFVYSKEGELLRKYGEGDIACSGGIAIDRNGFTYATEYYNKGRLVVFDPKGQKVFASSASGLDWPMGVCVSEDGRVFVACNMGEGVVVF